MYDYWQVFMSNFYDFCAVVDLLFAIIVNALNWTN